MKYENFTMKQEYRQKFHQYGIELRGGEGGRKTKLHITKKEELNIYINHLNESSLCWYIALSMIYVHYTFVQETGVFDILIELK